MVDQNVWGECGVIHGELDLYKASGQFSDLTFLDESFQFQRADLIMIYHLIQVP